jgi:ADP-heptose:LPS heptosyltransferase
MMKRNVLPLSVIKERRKLYTTFLLLYALLPVTCCIAGLKRMLGRIAGKEEKPFSILVIQLMKIGDVMCTTPVFRELRACYPQAHITAMVLPLTSGILENNPYVDEIIAYDSSVIEKNLRETLLFIKFLWSHQFEWSFIFSPNFRNIAYTCFAFIPNRVCIRTPYCSRITKAVYWSQTAILDYNSRTSAMKAYLETLQFIGISEYAMTKEIYIDPDDTLLVENFLENHQIGSEDPVIALHPFAGVQMKEWGKEKFVALADRLVERYHARILLVGASQDCEKAQELVNRAKYPLINTCGMFTLSQLPALLKKCHTLISVDTGPLYIANALGVPVVNIAGPCDLHTQSPDGIYEIVQKPLECVPCSFIMNAPKVCKRGDRKCLKIVTVDDVLEAFDRLTPYWQRTSESRNVKEVG